MGHHRPARPGGELFEVGIFRDSSVAHCRFKKFSRLLFHHRLKHHLLVIEVAVSFTRLPRGHEVLGKIPLQTLHESTQRLERFGGVRPQEQVNMVGGHAEA